MELQFWGAVRTTTGSMHILSAGDSRILLDCGLYQGRRKDAFEKNRNFPFDVSGIDHCLLSHAHIDHSGNIPTLVKKGYRGEIFATSATADLCEIMLLDSAHIQEHDVKFVNKKRAAQGKNLFEPLYVKEDAAIALKRFRALEYETPHRVSDGVVVTCHYAGHILGAAIISIEIKENGAGKKVVFSGDIGRKNMPILRNPAVPDDAEIVIIESTYGNRLHEKEEDVEKILKGIIERVLRRRSKLIIPAFSVGRTQQIVYILNRMYSGKKIPAVPIYVDSPLSTKATDVYMSHPECYDEQTQKWITEGNAPFCFKTLNYVSSAQESKKLNVTKGPMIVISASGMCEGGRILHHLAHAVEDEKNIILITGFQAGNTLGRRIFKKEPRIKIFGDEYSLRSEVEVINALSAHSDRDELLDWLKSMGKKVRKVFIVHGEEEAGNSMKEAINSLGIDDVVIPQPGESFIM